MARFVRSGFVTALVVTSCSAAALRGVSSPEPASPAAARLRVDRGALMDVVRELSSGKYGGRATGTPGGAAAGRAIEARFRRLGLEPVGGRAYRHPFELRRIGTGRTGRPLTGANIVGAVRGSRPGAGYIVVSAHYDHVGVVDGRLHPGADDNASGVAVLISAAAHFVRHRPVHPIMFVAFDGEELDLAGSRAFMARPPVPVGRMRLAVNLDMVSRSARNEIFAAGTSHYPTLRPPLERVRARASVRLSFGHDRAGDASREDWTDDSDHWPFHQAGVPFVYFGVEDHADYHQPTDTPDRIDAGFFGAVAEMIVDAVGELDRAGDLEALSGPKEPRWPISTGASASPP